MWPDDDGNWLPTAWVDPGGNQPYTGGYAGQTNSPMTSTSQTTAGQDSWSGFFQQAFGTVVNYAIAKDARQSGLVQQTGANGQPIYTASGQPVYRPAGSGAGLLVLAAAGVGLVLLLKKG